METARVPLAVPAMDWTPHPTLPKATVPTSSYASRIAPTTEGQIGTRTPDSLLPGSCNSTAGSPRKADGGTSE